MSIRDDAVEIMAKALFEHERERAVRDINIAIDTTYLATAGAIMSGSELRTQVLVGFSAVSQSLALGIGAHLRHGSSRERSELLEGLGPLATDAARMRLAKILGWLPSNIFSVVDALRKARNQIAHQIVRAEDVAIFERLDETNRGRLESRLETFVSVGISGDRPHWFLPSKNRVGAAAIMLASDVLVAILCGPGRLRLGSESIHFFTDDQRPDWMAGCAHNCAEGVVSLMVEEPESSPSD